MCPRSLVALLALTLAVISLSGTAVALPTGLRAEGTNLNDPTLPQCARHSTPGVRMGGACSQATAVPRKSRQDHAVEVVPLAIVMGSRTSAISSGVPKHVYDASLSQRHVLRMARSTMTTASGAVFETSAPARFRVSLLDTNTEDPWSGIKWLGSDSLNVYRTSFKLDALPDEAVFYVCGLGLFASANGVAYPKLKLVTAPWTNNEQLNGFSALDVRPLLRANSKTLRLSWPRLAQHQHVCEKR